MMSLQRIIATIACLIWGTRATTWLNSLDGPLHYQCPAHQSIKHVFSVHNNGAEDRQFSLSCADVPADFSSATENCFWTSNYVNDVDQPFAYSCISNHYIAGMDSIHDNGAEDRRWKFYCCSLPSYHMDDCEYSGWANTYDHNIDYTIPDDRVLRGVVSIHSNGAEDRIYDFEYCKLKKYFEESGPVG